MGEILFRGKRLDNGEWVYGDLLTKYIYHKDLTIVEKGFIYHEVDPETVGQYTGMKDVNETEIFGGDIVENDNGEVFIVEYWTGQAIVGWYLRSARTDDTQEMYCFGDSLRKIGNIHDNPELLEVE